MSQPIIVTTVAEAPVHVIWKAITDKDEMKKWYFDIPGFVPEPGHLFSFYGGSEEKKYLHLCEIIEVIPFQKLSYTWKYENIPGESIVSFELNTKGQHNTFIKLTHEGVENFATNNPDFAKQNFVEGWNHIIQTSLKSFAEGTIIE